MKKNTKLKSSSVRKNVGDDNLVEELTSISEPEFDIKFDNMLNEMNIHNRELRDAILAKDKETRVNMLVQFLRSSDKKTNTAHKKDTKPKTVTDFNTELSKSDVPHDYLLAVLQLLRVNLATNPLSWIQEFSESSAKKLKDIMIANISSIQSNYVMGQKILHECVKCMKSVMDSQNGLNLVMSDMEFIETLVGCLHPENPHLMSDVVRLLAAMSLVKYSMTLQCVSQVARKNNHNRFQKIIDGLEPHQPLSLKLNCLLFINAIITGAEDHKLRTYLRFELNRSGLPRVLPLLKNLCNQNMDVQLNVYEESRDDDIAEMQTLLNVVETNFETAEESFNVLYKSVKETPSECYLIGILHLLLTVDGDVVRRKNYFQLAEDFLTQLFLQKNGIDYDFNAKPFEINFEPILEGMSNRTVVDELQSRLEIIELKYTKEVTAKSEMEAKLAITMKNCDVKVKSAEEECNRMSKKVKEQEKLIDQLNSDLAVLKDSRKAEAGSYSLQTLYIQSELASPSQPPPPMNDELPPAPPPPPPSMDFDDGVPPPPGLDDGVPPPPPPGFDDGVSPPPPPPGVPDAPGVPFASVVARPQPVKKKYKPSEPTKRLNWTKIPFENLDQRSFWKDVDETEFENTTLFNRITNLFCSKSKQTVNTMDAKADDVNSGKKKIKEPIVLDSKTVQNLSIFIGTLKFSYDEIMRKILQFDRSVITETFVENIIKFCPPAEQRNMLLEHQTDYDDLADAEQFIFKISSIKELDMRFSFMLIMCKFNEQVNDIKPQIACVVSSCKEIMGCKKLHGLFKLILLIGNYMNSGSRNECSFGFEINFISRLSDTKTQDNTMTFMNFLAEVVDSEYPHLLGFEKELASIQLAMKVNEENVVKCVNQISKNLSQIETNLKKFDTPMSPDDTFGHQLSTFYKSASDQMVVLQEMLETMKKEFKDVTDFFLASKLSIEELFSIFNQFITEFEKAVTDNKRRAEKIERDIVNKRKIEEEKLKKEDKKRMLGSVDQSLHNDKNKNLRSANGKEAVIDGLLQALESGSAFQQQKNVGKKAKIVANKDLLKERKRTMNLNARDLFRQMLKDGKDDDVEAQL